MTNKTIYEEGWRDGRTTQNIEDPDFESDWDSSISKKQHKEKYDGLLVKVVDVLFTQKDLIIKIVKLKNGYMFIDYNAPSKITTRITLTLNTKEKVKQLFDEKKIELYTK